MVISVDEYLKSLNDGRIVYYRGKPVQNVAVHKILSVPVKHASSIYRLQQDINYKKMMCFNDGGDEISAFYKLPSDAESLLERHKLIYETTRLGRGQFNIVKAIGTDAIMALLFVSKKIDAAHGTSYYERAKKFYEYAAANDLSLSLAQTDVKGNRSLKPSEQEDKDMYLHIVKKDSKGIYVSGAKAHTTQSIASNEIIAIPTRNMGEADRDYAVAFSIPANTEGITMIARPLKEVETALNDRLSVIGRENIEVETITVFDNVFVPNDRIFMAGEYEFAGLLAVMFPTFHRFTAISYRAAMADFLIGVARLLADYNGIGDKSNIRRNISTLISYKEVLRATAIAASHDFAMDKDSKIAIPNIIYTNVGKLYANENYTDVVKNIVDIAGGLVATMPSSEDFDNPVESAYLLKYLKGRSGKETVERLHLIETLREFISSMGSLYLAGMIHAEGSIEASIMELCRSYDYTGSIDLAKFASGINKELKK
ncbi:MAG: 4-hydroxyphenylacetate 3-hydroxylase N-terminal domain-containing protein [Ferroplasma sp.]